MLLFKYCTKNNIRSPKIFNYDSNYLSETELELKFVRKSKEDRHIQEKLIEEEKLKLKQKEKEERAQFMKLMEVKGMHQRLESLGDTGQNCFLQIIKKIFSDSQLKAPAHSFYKKDALSSDSNNSSKTFAKSISKLIAPQSEAILEKVPTVSSTESIGETVLNPSIKLRNKFNDIQLNLSNREEIYSYL